MAQGPGGRGRAPTFDEGEAEVHEDQMQELRERLLIKLEALRERTIREEGHTLDEATGSTVPPGYIRDPDDVAKPR